MDIIYRYDPHAPLQVESPRSGREALDRLAAGNARFLHLVERMHRAADGDGDPEPVVIPVTPLSMGVPFASGYLPAQAPYALVLGCSDARAPIEHIFDCGANEVFVVRVAGNVLGLECLGSVDYAVEHLADSLRTGIVLGHTGCGAVTAAVDMYLSARGFANIASTHAVRSLVDRIMLAVRAAASVLDDRLESVDRADPEYRRRLITTAIFLNAAITAFDVQREICAMTRSDVGVAFAVYDVSRSRVSALPQSTDPTADAESTPVFLPAPQNDEQVGDLARRIVDRLLDAEPGRRTVML